MSALDWIVLVVCLATPLYWYLTRHYDYWKKVGVPTLPGVLPGVGNMWDAFIFKASSHWLISDWYKYIHTQPAIGLYDFRKPALLIKDLDLVQEVLIKEFSSFHDNTFYFDSTLDKHFSKNPFAETGESWKTVRQQLNPAFSPAKIKAMFPLFQRVCLEFNKYIEKHIDDDIDAHRVSELFTSELIAKCAFGVDGNSFSASDFGEFYQNGRKMWNASLFSPVTMILFMYLPIVKKILRKSFVPEDVIQFFVNLVNQAEDYRINNPDKAPDDYLQYLLNLEKKDSAFTIDDVVAQSLTFFTDGFESLSLNASFIIYELTVNPGIQEAVRQEVKSMESFTYDNVVSLDLLDRVIKETLRKYVLYGSIKKCTKDYDLHSKGSVYPIRKGMHVMIPVYAIHHDPEHYPEPDKFNPDRFLPDIAKSRHPMAFLSFGGGPRMCMGNRFASAQMKVFIANILTHFQLIECEKTVQKMTFFPDQILPISKGGVWCRFKKL